MNFTNKIIKFTRRRCWSNASWNTKKFRQQGLFLLFCREITLLNSIPYIIPVRNNISELYTNIPNPDTTVAKTIITVFKISWFDQNILNDRRIWNQEQAQINTHKNKVVDEVFRSISTSIWDGQRCSTVRRGSERTNIRRWHSQNAETREGQESWSKQYASSFPILSRPLLYSFDNGKPLIFI